MNGSTPQRGEDRISTAIVGDPSSGIQPNPPQTAPLSPREGESVRPTPPSSPPEPEATAGDDPPWPDDETSPEVAEAPPSAAQNLVEDPRFQKLLRTFGGRIRKLVQDTPKAPDAEGATQSDEGSDE